MATKKLKQVYETFEEDLPISIPTKAEIKEASTFNREQALALVGMYYTMQKIRIAASNRVSAHNRRVDILADSAIIVRMKQNLVSLERKASLALKAYAESNPLGRWAMSHTGVAHVLAAGLLAHIDLYKANTAGAIWRFAGLDPTIKWEKGQKRPYNAALKVICWRMGKCFAFSSNKPGAFYGQMYRKRKELEIQKNESGAFKDYALGILERVKREKRNATPAQIEAWSQGKVPPLGLDRMAMRYTVKMFLSHYHTVGREILGLAPIKPWVIEHGGHVHYIPPPNWPMVEE